MFDVSLTIYFSVVIYIFAFLTAFFVLWKRRRLYYLSYKLKGPFALPCIGNLLEVIKNPDGFVEKYIEDRKKYGSPYRIWLGTKLFVCISNPEDFEILFNSPYALGKKQIYDIYKPLVGEGLFTCGDVSRWRRNRKLIAKTFNQAILNGFIPIFQEQSLILCEKLEKMVGAGSFNVYSSIVFCHMDIICETTTGVKINVQQGESKYVMHLERLFDIMYARVFNLLLYPDFIFKRTAVGKEQEKLINYIRNFNKNVMNSKRKQYERSPQDICPENNKVIVDYLMETGQFTNDDVETELITFILAGSDTGSTSESYTLMLLGMHPEVQDKVFEEQQEIFGDNQREITYSDLSQMKYLERVIKESLRIFPIGGMIYRDITNDIQLRTCTLPKGVTVSLGMLDAHRNPHFWGDPLKFDPDRFLPEKIAKVHPYAYIPFSAGPRDCIGQRYGMMVMKVVLSTIVRKYRIHCECKVEDVKLIQHFTLKPKDGFKVSLELRN